MKKCMLCLAMICLILAGCQTALKPDQDAPDTKLKSSTIVPAAVVTTQPTTVTRPIVTTSRPTVSQTATNPTPIPTIWPIGGGTTTGMPPCAVYNQHIYRDGYCVYCGNRDRSWQPCTGSHNYVNGLCVTCGATQQGYDLCAAGHTYKHGYCMYCAAQDPDFPPCKDGHTFVNGFCEFCPAVDANYDFCADGHIYQYGYCIYCGIIDENYSPCQAGHTFNDGYCIYCLAMDPNYDPCANGHTYQYGYCIYCLKQQPSAGQPTTTRPTTAPICDSTPRKPTTCGLPQCYGKGHTFKNGFCIYCAAVDPDYSPCAKGHTFQNGFCIYCLVEDPDYHPCAGGHTFENGWCIYCAAPSSMPTAPTVPTTNVTTPIAPSRAIGYVEKKAGLTGVELTSGDQTVAAFGKMRTTSEYVESTGDWRCALGSGVQFSGMAEEDIPVLTHVTAIRICIPENATFEAVYVQSEKTGQSELSSLFQMAELVPGTYYVKIGITYHGDTYEGRQENSYYEYGFKLIKTIA